MANGYEDIDRLVEQQRAGYNEAMRQQNDIVNQQTQMQVDSLARQKEQIDKEATAQNKALYQDYKKNINPFGVQAENLAGQGLANSGYAETTLSRMYNTYQNNITSTLNNARDLKADVDFQINQARQTGNITLAQNALELYKQKMQLLTEEYDLRNNREQYLYQKEQDALQQANWQKEFSYQQSRDKVSDTQWNKQFKYQQKRDKVSDSQWQKEYELSKKARASSSRGGSTGYNNKYNNQNNQTPINLGEDTNNKKTTNNANSNKVVNSILKVANGILKQTTTGKVAKATKEALKTGARQYIYRAVENNLIDDKQAKSIYKKLGLEK